MTTFENGPAVGQTLRLARAPKFLRVCRAPDLTFDALDQVEDMPKPEEALIPYEIVGEPTRAFIRPGGLVMIARYRWKDAPAMSSAVFVGIRCDGCKQPFQLAEQANDRAFFADEARKVRTQARAAGWRCRSWELKTGKMVDACPKCVPVMKWGRKVDLFGRTSKP